MNLLELCEVRLPVDHWRQLCDHRSLVGIEHEALYLVGIQSQLRSIFVINPNDVWPGKFILRASLSNGFDPGFARGRRRRRSIGASLVREKREGHPKYVYVFRPEQAVRFNVIRCSSQAASYHLLAQKLGSERAQSHDVGDGLGGPAFR